MVKYILDKAKIYIKGLANIIKELEQVIMEKKIFNCVKKLLGNMVK